MTDSNAGPAAAVVVATEQNDDDDEGNVVDDDAVTTLDERERWAKLGMLGLRFSRAVPAVSFLLGPLAIERKQRQTTARQVRQRVDNSELQEAEQVWLLSIWSAITNCN
jgi:hypothetical protein